ncbi:hypothetical protein D3C81_2217390 [compost metagenome]
MIGREDRIHMPGQQQADRRVGPHCQVKMLAMRDGLDRAALRNAFNWLAVDEPDVAGQYRKGASQAIRHLG